MEAQLIDYDKDDITGYIVPTMPTGFIQLGAELGFVFSLFRNLLLRHMLCILFKSNLNIDNKWFVFLILPWEDLLSNLIFQLLVPVLALKITMALITFTHNPS